MELCEEYTQVLGELKSLRLKVKELTKKERDLNTKIMERMQELNIQKLGNIVWKRKKVLRGEFDKKTVRDKIASQLEDPHKTDALTEQIFRKEVSYKDVLQLEQMPGL